MKSKALTIQLKNGQTIKEHHTNDEAAQTALFAAFKKYDSSLVGYSIKEQNGSVKEELGTTTKSYIEVK